MVSHLVFLSLISTTLIICEGFPQTPVIERTYKIEAYQQNGDTSTLVLRLQPAGISKLNNRKARQEDEDDGEEAASPSAAPTMPYIPAIIPGITKIFSGILTGNLNEIFHGSTSFAPQNVSHAIDSVYNQVVGLPPPRTTPPSTLRPLVVEPVVPASAPAAIAPGAPAAASVPAVPAAPLSGGVAPGQPLATQAPAVITEPSTTRATSNEDDEEEEPEGFGFRRSALSVSRRAHR